MDFEVPPSSTPAPPPPAPRPNPQAPRVATPHHDRLLALQDDFYAILRALEQVSNDVYQEFPDTDSDPAEVRQLHDAIAETVQGGEALLDRVWFHCTGTGMTLDEAMAVPEADPVEDDEDDDTGPRIQCGEPMSVEASEGLPVRTVLITEDTEHGQVDYVLNDEILALMAQDPTQAFKHLVDATADARDTDDDRSITKEEVCALVVAIFKIHGVPVPPEARS
jgi:hypothetical protein